MVLWVGWHRFSLILFSSDSLLFLHSSLSIYIIYVVIFSYIDVSKNAVNLENVGTF
jgi:hypothetical protein